MKIEYNYIRGCNKFRTCKSNPYVDNRITFEFRDFDSRPQTLYRISTQRAKIKLILNIPLKDIDQFPLSYIFMLLGIGAI